MSKKIEYCDVEDLIGVERVEYENECLKQQLKDTKKEILELKNKLKLANTNITYYKNKFDDCQRRIKYLEGHSADLQYTIDRGYKEGNFNKEHAGIYRIFNKTTGQSYVGQSHVDVYNRCMQHYNYKDPSIDDWHYDIKYNPENYDYEIIEEGVKNQGDLDKKEIYYIGYYHCLDEGYNSALAAQYRFLGLDKKIHNEING